MACAPLRILCNEQNLIRTGTLYPSGVMPADNAALETPAARTGTAGVTLTGSYTGDEDAILDIEIVDDSADTKRASTPVLIGQGTGTLTGITATGGFAAQDVTVELKDAGLPVVSAALDFEGVKLVAVNAGADGNNISINVEQGIETSPAGLVFEASNFSLLEDLAAGAGAATTGLSGPGWDWETAALGEDGAIPADAKRVAFGDDTTVYLAYKVYADNAWAYHFVPALARAVPKGTAVKFVTGGRVVTITDASTSPVTVETYADIVTVYDLLAAIRENSALVTVDGIVANDRTPTGQAARELSARTDAHVAPSSGSGSRYATGVESAYAEADASTELVTLRCYAVTGRDHPLAMLGRERWEVEGSLSGALDDAITGTAYVADTFGFLIPRRLPSGYGTPKGAISVTDISYASRDPGETEPPICVVSAILGPNAQDQTVTMTYRTRPTGDCACDEMAAPDLRGACIGAFSTGGESMGYSSANKTRLVGLYQWYADTVRTFSEASGVASQASFLSQPPGGGDGFIAEPMKAIVAAFEEALSAIDESAASADKTAAEAAWETALIELQADVALFDSGLLADGAPSETVSVSGALSAGDAVIVYRDNDGNKFARRYDGAHHFDGRPGFVLSAASVTSPESTITVYYAGINHAKTGLTPGNFYVPDAASPGSWSTAGAVFTGVVAGDLYAWALSTTELAVRMYQGAGTDETQPFRALTDRYRARLDQVMITGNLSPLGKSEANILTSGDGCWRDWGDAAWWETVGSEGGAYGAAFSNRPFYSSRLASDGRTYWSTKEFALQINVKCPEDLRDGDTITLSINGASWPSTYQVGDEITLPILAARDLSLAGGQDGDTVQTWNVRGSVAGPLANYTLDTASPSAYSASGLAFTITEGGIPFELGDKFTFSVEGGHFRWRVNGGAWNVDSPPLDIPSGSTLLYEGLSATFPAGAAPSFATGDVYSFRLLQPRAASNAQTPGSEAWQWDGASATMTVDLGSLQDIETLAIALHTLPEGCTITVEGAAAHASPWAADWTESLTWREGVIFAEPATPREARYLRFIFTSAEDATVGWLYAGPPITTTRSADLTLSRAWKVDRGDGGLYQGGRYRGKAVAGEIEWDESLTEADLTALQGMLDWVKENDDEPVIIVPNYTRPAEAFLGRVAVDEVEFPDVSMYQANSDKARRHSTRIPVAGVWA